MKSVVAVFLMCFLFINCDKKEEVKTITTINLKKLLDKENIQLLDVRSPKEIEKGCKILLEVIDSV